MLDLHFHSGTDARDYTDKNECKGRAGKNLYCNRSKASFSYWLYSVVLVQNVITFSWVSLAADPVQPDALV